MHDCQYDNFGIRIIFCTMPNKKSALILAQQLIKNNLSACITLLNNATSVYYWNGILEKQNEVQMIIKSHLSKESELLKQIKNNHPYAVPELLSIPVSNIDKNYLFWIKKVLNII